MMRQGRNWLTASSVLAPLVVFLSIWAPEITHYYVPGTTISGAILQESRVNPPDPVLGELQNMRLGTVPRFASNLELIAAARDILNGKLRLPGKPAVDIALPMSEGDLRRYGLDYASFIIPQILLDAYELSGDERFFSAARDVILAWTSYERSAWFDEGFMWNDHAIAARVAILGMFWRLYRGRPDYRPEVAQAVLQMAARSGQLLAKSDHFTFATNHGVMQNLALWHLVIAFPALPGADEWRRLALERMRDQMGFYVDSEGAVLEHSAGYQLWGVQLLGMALRYLTLLDIAPPAAWVEKYRKAKLFYGDLRRPDGTLPMYGDTDSVSDSPLVAAPDASGRVPALQHASSWRPSARQRLDPVAGNLVQWGGLDDWPSLARLTQTVVHWSYFPGHGHKLADEMSTLLWGGGQTWVTNSGYWPYGAWGGSQVAGWAGSNAPHLTGEATRSARKTRLNGFAFSENLTFVDLERSGPEGYVARRQVVRAGSSVWLVLDHVQDQMPRQTVTTWTVGPDLVLTQGPQPGLHYLRSPARELGMSVVLFGSVGTKVQLYKGSKQPFAGWVVVDGQPRPADAFVVEQPSRDSWAVALWALQHRDGGATIAGLPRMIERPDGDRWEIDIPISNGTLIVQRHGNQISMRDSRRTGENIDLAIQRGPDVDRDRATIAAAYSAAAGKYKKYRNIFDYRLKMSYLLVIALLCEAIILLVFRAVRPNYVTALSLLSILSWVSGGIWLNYVYFVS